MITVDVDKLSEADQQWLAKHPPAGGGEASEADWPSFRGRNHDGKSPDKGLLKQWPPRAAEVAVEGRPTSARAFPAWPWSAPRSTSPATWAANW